MIHYIYKITNTINNKVYVGIHSTNNINDGYMGSGVALKSAFKKYGLSNFTKEVIQTANTREEVSNLETQIVTEEFCKLTTNYNLKTGGDECCAHHESTRKKMSIAQTGRKRTPERIEQMRQHMLKNNPMQNEESRNKVRQSKLGKPRSQELKDKVSATLKGKQPAFLNPRVKANQELINRWRLLDQIYDLKQSGMNNADIARSFNGVFKHTTAIRAMLEYISKNGDPRKDHQWLQFMNDTHQ